MTGSEQNEAKSHFVFEKDLKDTHHPFSTQIWRNYAETLVKVDNIIPWV